MKNKMFELKSSETTLKYRGKTLLNKIRHCTVTDNAICFPRLSQKEFLNYIKNVGPIKKKQYRLEGTNRDPNLHSC